MCISLIKNFFMLGGLFRLSSKYGSKQILPDCQRFIFEF